MQSPIADYNAALSPEHAALCARLATEIGARLAGAESKLWHGHPVWFLAGNPIVGYSRQKAGVRLMFWSGAGFDEPELSVLGGRWKDASVILNRVGDLKVTALRRWLRKSRAIQWDYKNIVKRRGRLVRLKP